MRSGSTTPPVGEALHKLADSVTSLDAKTEGKTEMSNRLAAKSAALIISGNHQSRTRAAKVFSSQLIGGLIAVGRHCSNGSVGIKKVLNSSENKSKMK